MTFANWLDTYASEKGIDTEQTLSVHGESGQNLIPIGCVLDAVKQASAREQGQIKKTLIAIDIKNGDPVHFIKHIAQAIAH